MTIPPDISDDERDDNVDDLTHRLTEAERQQELAELEAEERPRLAKLFRKCRHALELTQAELARILDEGRTGRTISKWESGTHHIPGTAWLALIALLLADYQGQFVAEKLLNFETGPVSGHALSFFALRLGTDPPFGYKIVSVMDESDTQH